MFLPLRRNVGIFSQRGGTIGWLVNGDGVLVVDSQFADTAPNLMEALKQRSSRRIDVLINSHHHPDHTSGNGVLRPSADKIVAHARSLQNQRERAQRDKTETTLPDTTFTDSWSVTIGDETVRAKHYGPAHTGGDVAIFFERANVLHLGDLLNNRGYPNIDVPAGASMHGWIRVLETITPQYQNDTLFVYGHGESGFGVTGTKADLSYQRDYFNAILDTVRKAMRAGKSREEVLKLDTPAGFEHFGGQRTRLGLALGIAFDELTAKS
jgi:glyoxylase-like metal-dependent hydrolase (beta-lactamase superfamily II)